MGKYAAIRIIVRTILIMVIAFLVLGNCSFAYLMIDKLNMNDFGKFYYSTVAFLKSENMYGPSPATLVPVTESVSKQFWNLNPPHFHLALLPLGFLSPKIALALWGSASLLCLICSLGLIVREVGVEITPIRFCLGMLGFLSFVGTSAVLVTGQLSFLLLLPVTLAWVEARRGRWILTGMYVGLAISIKPFLLIFMPYLLFRRQFRAAATACSIVALSCAIGLAVFGIDTYTSWLRALSLADWSWASMNASIQGILARALAQSPYYAPIAELPHLITPLWLVVVSFMGLLTMAFAVFDSSDHAVDRSFALLLFGALLVSPLGWVYYLWLPLGPMSVLVPSWFLRSRPRSDPSTSRTNRVKTGLLLVALLGFIFPYPATVLFQPRPLATLVFGSIYFWASLVLWICLIMDFLNSHERYFIFRCMKFAR
jgi:hypothetical protein